MKSEANDFFVRLEALCVAAYKLGQKAKEEGLPRECNLGYEYYDQRNIFKVYKSAWEEGWDDA